MDLQAIENSNSSSNNDNTEIDQAEMNQNLVLNMNHINNNTNTNNLNSVSINPDSPIMSVSSEEEAKLYLLCTMFRCRKCISTVKDRSSCCCAGSALSSALPSNFPIDLLPIIEGYLLNSVSNSFLTHPPPSSVGVVQCYILKSGTKYELFMEIEHHPVYQGLQTKINQRGPRTQLERSKLLEVLFKERLNRISDTRTVEAKIKENNMKSMLLDNAEAVVTRGQDVYLLSATCERSWSGNKYIISTDGEQPNDKCSKNNNNTTVSDKSDNNNKGANNHTTVWDKNTNSNTTVSDKGDNNNKSNTNNNNTKVMGKLKSNFGGTEFVMFEAISSPKAVEIKYRESGIVRYDHFLRNTGSPIRIKILLPNPSFYEKNKSVNYDLILKQFEFESKESGNHLQSAEDLKLQQELDTRRNEENVTTNRLTQNKPNQIPLESNELLDFGSPNQQIECYENLMPIWHDRLNAYSLHFDNHRISEKSMKNFKLVRSNDVEKRTVLQFGRVVPRNRYIMDFTFPLTALQAFQICLSSIDPKLAV